MAKALVVGGKKRAKVLPREVSSTKEFMPAPRFVAFGST